MIQWENYIEPKNCVLFTRVFTNNRITLKDIERIEQSNLK